LISAAQKVEHYEIASYGIMKTLTAVLGYHEAAGLLETTLGEEKACDEKLTGLAEEHINEYAASEKK
jgi:ferritin-like metal-binding protein YciE